MPKNKSAYALSDFKPIACCNIFYKIISKILTNRLQKVINHLVSLNQSSFIKGQLITDNILLSHELVRDFSNTFGSARVALKGDLKKAYVTVRQKFL